MKIKEYIAMGLRIILKTTLYLVCKQYVRKMN